MLDLDYDTMLYNTLSYLCSINYDVAHPFVCTTYFCLSVAHLWNSLPGLFKLNPLLLLLRDVYITNSSHVDISMSSCSYAFYHAELLENIFVAGGCKLAVLEDMPSVLLQQFASWLSAVQGTSLICGQFVPLRVRVNHL